MRKGLKWVLGIIAGILVLAVGLYCVLRFGFAIDVLDRSGWDDSQGQVRYLDYYGEPLLQWQTVDGETYYFDPGQGGAMVTGWLELDGQKYYLDTDGKRLTGWVDTPEGRYYLQEDGTALQGWYSAEAGTYYLSPDSGAVTGWQELEQSLYYFNSEGLLQTGWLALKQGQYYLGDSGAAVTGWAELEGSRYYFDETGAMHTGWAELDGNRYYFTEAGALATGWQTVEGNRYCFDENGAMCIGWYETDAGKCYFDAGGSLLTGWADIDEKRYYFDESGIMQTGWLEYESDRYYLREDGSMAVGEVEIDGVSNFFTSKGKYVVLVNQWHLMPEDYELDLVNIEGYQIDSSCRDALQQMLDACRAAGYRCTINNTYRSVATQQYMWDVRIEQRTAEGMSYNEAVAYIGQSLARVGASEHHLGLAVDIDGGDATYEWLAENCWDYGFILRYPADRIEITGIIYEPWHFRYVGTELSLELEELGLCMEEYMDMLTQSQQEAA